jgi:hypothetical protein
MPAQNNLDPAIQQALAGVLAQRKTSSQFSPNSDSNAEKPDSSEPSVADKLKNKGEGFESAGQSDWGVQSNRLLIENNPNIPLADKGNDLDKTHAEDQIPGQTLDTVMDSAGEPTMKMPDPQSTAGEPEVSEKLKLKKDASMILEKTKELEDLGMRIIDHLTELTVNKSASAPPVTPPAAHNTAAEATALAASDVDMGQVKRAMINLLEDAVYAADVIALDAKQRQNNLLQQSTALGKSAALPATPPAAQPSSPQEPKAANAIDPAALSAMGDMGGMGGMGGGMGGEPDISEEEANALLAESLSENGVDPAGLGGGMSPEMGAMGDPAGEGAEISPEMLQSPEAQAAIAELVAALQQTGVEGISPEDIAAALADVDAIEAAGIDPNAAAIADEEAGKTGHYKFASFIDRPRNKSAEQIQRSAKIRGAVRDFLYGPGTRDFT